VDRRNFLKTSGAVAGSRLTAPRNSADKAEFTSYQHRRRQELWNLLGDLPRHRPGPPKLLRTEKASGYTLEHLVLDLNGIEPVPALLLIPDQRQPRAPGLLYIHAHFGTYEIGKDELLNGRKVMPAYAPVCAEKGLLTLAIDSWCFGERKHEADGHEGESDAFKLMLWRGQVLFGMMMWDEHQALSYLASRPEVDPARLGTFGLSMGSTKSWWLAALDPRVSVCMDLCCMTDYQSLIRAHNLKGHGIYYYVPSLLNHFQTADINELIVPRPHISLNGRRDDLTPPEGVERVRDHLLPLYRRYGREQDFRMQLFDCVHQELPEMRQLFLDWMDRYLVNSLASIGD
jgi:hypothetical protein